MRKLIKPLLLLFSLLLCMSTAVSAGLVVSRDSYREKAVKVIHDGEEDGEMTLRFYNWIPNIPYLGIRAYSQYMMQLPMTVRENGDGTCSLINSIDEELLCDPTAGKIVIADWNRFFDLPLPLENIALGWKDTSTPFIRFTNVEYEGEAKPVELDFAKYGIQIYADENDIYLPVSTLSNMMTDIATNHILYNGESLYVQRVSLDGSSPDGLYETEMLRAELQGKNRPADIRKQCYADLCFTMDYFFGHPGKAPLDEALAEKGLDQALTDLGEDGEKLKASLLSPSLSDYLAGMNKLFMDYLGDGHTLFFGSSSIMNGNPGQLDTLSSLQMAMGYMTDLVNSPVYLRQALTEFITVQRNSAWGDDVYRESGNTAIIRLDSFMPNEEAWDLYYKGEGNFPEDCVGIVYSGLRKAAKNPEIENVIFDLSCNSGGSPDAMMAILAVSTGQTQLYGYHRLTDRRMTFTFETDANFDGVYDEKDKEIHYDFNYGILVTRHAFSCGNLFPIIAREAGAIVLGEKSSGGSCCVQVGTDSEAFTYMMSSAQWILLDSEGNDVEDGCEVDLPIETESNRVTDAIIGLLGVKDGMPVYDNYFNDTYLSGLMNGYFHGQAQEAGLLPAA